MKVSDLRTKTPLELNGIVLTLTRELFDLRMQKTIGEAQMKSHHFKKVRRLIARTKTILTEKANMV